MSRADTRYAILMENIMAALFVLFVAAIAAGLFE